MLTMLVLFVGAIALVLGVFALCVVALDLFGCLLVDFRCLLCIAWGWVAVLWFPGVASWWLRLWLF